MVKRQPEVYTINPFFNCAHDSYKFQHWLSYTLTICNSLIYLRSRVSLTFFCKQKKKLIIAVVTCQRFWQTTHWSGLSCNNPHLNLGFTFVISLPYFSCVKLRNTVEQPRLFNTCLTVLWNSLIMGNLFAKKKVSKVTEHDKAVLVSLTNNTQVIKHFN